MQEHDDNRDTNTSPGDTANGSQLKLWERQIATFVIVAVFVMAIVGAGLLIQTYIINHKPVLEMLKLVYSFFKPILELLAYGSLIFFIVDYLAQIIDLKISTLVLREQNRIIYLLLICIFLLFLSLGLLFTSHKLEQEWWTYFSAVTLGISLITMTVSIVVNKNRKQLSDILRFISYVLLLTGVVLIFLEVIKRGF